MIKSVTVTNPKNESLVLELREPETPGLYIKSIDGLGPPKATINTTELASVDGGLFSSSRITERNIVITLGMMWSPTIEAARLRTYKYFPIKKEVRILVETDNRKAEAVGRVESHDPNIFSNQETTQISIICPDPFFYEVGNEETVFSGVAPVFEFPFSNESLDENLIEFGDIHLDTRAVLNYVGDVDTGIRITIHALDTVRNITLYNTQTFEQMAISTDKIRALTGRPFAAGDDIVLNTIRGQRFARLLRDGTYINIISAINKNADWFQLSNGDNIFTYTAAEGEKAVQVSFFYRNAYGGV